MTLATRRIKSRVLLTLDLDFANIRAYPPERYPGIIVLRLKTQDKATVIRVCKKNSGRVRASKPRWRTVDRGG